MMHHSFQFCNGFARQILGFRQFIAVFERVVFQPSNIQLVLAIFDFTDVEPAKATIFTGVLSLALTVRIRPVAFFEFFKMLWRQRAILLGDSWNIGTCVEDPDVLGGSSFGKENDVCFNALAVGSEGTSGQTKDRVDIAIL